MSFSGLVPSGPPPGCYLSYSGTFEITVANATLSKRTLSRRQGPLGISLVNGVLTDQNGRTGYIASNDQFQFDRPPQAGAIYIAGFSLCANYSLAIGTTAIWYQCLSGAFYNIYDAPQGTQCSQIYVEAINRTGSIISTSQSKTATSSLTKSLLTTSSLTTSLFSTSASPSASAPAVPASVKPGDIAGIVIGAVAGVALIIGLAIVILRKKRKKRRAILTTNSLLPEKAQLHSDDLKPDRKELEGSKAPVGSGTFAELPAKEPVERGNEMPVNEVVGAEMQMSQRPDSNKIPRKPVGRKPAS